jgi:hypothetical protein
MKIEYRGTLLEIIIAKNKVQPIDFVTVSKLDFDVLFDEATEKGILLNCDDKWFNLKGLDITFYLSAVEEDYEYR